MRDPLKDTRCGIYPGCDSSISTESPDATDSSASSLHVRPPGPSARIVLPAGSTRTKAVNSGRTDFPPDVSTPPPDAVLDTSRALSGVAAPAGAPPPVESGLARESRCATVAAAAGLCVPERREISTAPTPITSRMAPPMSRPGPSRSSNWRAPPPRGCTRRSSDSVPSSMGARSARSGGNSSCGPGGRALRPSAVSARASAGSASSLNVWRSGPMTCVAKPPSRSPPGELRPVAMSIASSSASRNAAADSKPRASRRARVSTGARKPNCARACTESASGSRRVRFSMASSGNGGVSSSQARRASPRTSSAGSVTSTSSSSCDLGIPRSSSFTRPSGRTRMLALLMLPCTRPAACAAASASASLASSLAVSSTVQRWPARFSASTVSPSTSSMTTMSVSASERNS